MRLSRIYIDAALSYGDEILLPDDNAHYIKNVLRLKSGSPVILFNGIRQTDFSAIIRMAGKQVFAEITGEHGKNTESSIQTILIQAMGKPDHMDFLIQKTTELGINTILIFNSERTQSHLKSARLDKKIQHWSKICISASEQCGRNLLPIIHFEDSLESCINKTPLENRLILDFDGQRIQQLTDDLSPQGPFTFLVGAEGGLTQEEIEMAINNGFKNCVLGSRVLRMETAGIALQTIIQHHFGDL